ncbi:MAG: protein-L-isoaspartate(D-aspartate) O-methyltransferase [candidate division WOR-3 bacterium]
MSVNYKHQRERMVEEQIISRGISDERVLKAMREVPRHKFVEEGLRSAAYQDNPLPIGWEQTISQPYIVALMTELLDVDKTHKVLEVGTGSGYQAAILSLLAMSVITIERIPELYKRAKETLRKLGYNNITVVLGDGSIGYKEYAPYDRIMVTAAAPSVPEELIQQLKENGKIVIPVGNIITQELIVLRKEKDKIVTTKSIGVRFVPLKGKGGWQNGA